MSKYLSQWVLFLTTQDLKKSEKILSKFIKENDHIKLNAQINYSIYQKDNTVKAQFLCEHEAMTWEEIAFKVILTVQNSATSLILTNYLEEEVNIFTNHVHGAKGGVRALHVTLVRENFDATFISSTTMKRS